MANTDNQCKDLKVTNYFKENGYEGIECDDAYDILEFDDGNDELLESIQTVRSFVKHILKIRAQQFGVFGLGPAV